MTIIKAAEGPFRFFVAGLSRIELLMFYIGLFFFGNAMWKKEFDCINKINARDFIHHLDGRSTKVRFYSYRLNPLTFV